MSTKKKLTKQTFADKLATKLKNLEGKVTQDSFSDKSASWVCYKVGNKTLTFTFDYNGNHLEDIGVYKDIVQVVDEKRIF
jgi:hypothetical protein